MPFFSIVIPCYNGEKTLAATLDSVCLQTFKDFEVVLVNDGSTDSSPQIIEAYMERLPIVLVNQENSGLGAARNTGIRNSEGDFVAFLDADDLWMPRKLQCVFDLISNLNGQADVICHSEDLQRGGVSLRVLEHGPYTSYLDLLLKGNTLSPSATCVRRSLLKDVGLFSLDKKGHGAEDWDLWLKLAKNNAKIKYIKEVLGVYVLYGTNMSESPDFHQKGRYVFESHVAQLSPMTPELKSQVMGARAIHELYAAMSHASAREYLSATRAVWAAFSSGLFNLFFWNRLSTKSYSVFRHAFLN